MKRSEINRCIEDAPEFRGKLNFALPPFARSAAESRTLHAAECREETVGLRLGGEKWFSPPSN